MNGETIVAPRPEHVADAVGAQPHFGREQFGRVDAVEQRDEHIDRQQQAEAGRNDQHRVQS